MMEEIDLTDSKYEEGRVTGAISSKEEPRPELNFAHPQSLQRASFAFPSDARRITEDSPEGCGWWRFRPRCIQKTQTAKWLLFALCWAGAIQGMVVNGYVNVSITTIEKRFNLKSSNTGLIAGSYDIASVLCAIPVSYLGSLPGASKPRWLGWGVLILGLGSFVFVLPHFASPTYISQIESTQSVNSSIEESLVCIDEPRSSACPAEEMSESLSSFKHVFFLGQFLHGVGATPLYTLGTAYLDESVMVKMSSLYLGYYHGMAAIGPAIGYILGGYFLSFYIDSPQQPAGSLSTTSERWLGAWWIGFLVTGTIAAILAIFILAFPREIPGASERTADRIKRGGEISGSEAKAFSRIRDLPGAAKVLLRNPCFVFLSLAESCEGILLAGFATFMPKVIQSQFGISAGFSAALVGILAVPAAAGGTLLGGWLIKYLKLECDGILRYCYALNIVAFIFCIPFIMSCPNVDFSGVNSSYDNESSLSTGDYSLLSDCNSQCNCLEKNYNPVCGEDGLQYYSPCHAGCINYIKENQTKTYVGCRCIKDYMKNSNKTIDFMQGEFSARNEGCDVECNLLPFFLVIFFFVMLLTFLISLPGVSATLRCVPDSHRSFGLGIQWIFIRLLGTIPGPILFGAAIDNTCILWQEACDGTGSCRMYDNGHLSRSLMALALSFKGMSTFFFFIAWWIYTSKIRQNAKSPVSTVVSLTDKAGISNVVGIENQAFEG